MGFVYKISSLVNPSRVYIGSTCNFDKRTYEHIYRLKKGTHHAIKLQRHFNKYGINDLVFQIIKECNDGELIKCEQDFIDTVCPYFNSRKNASSNKGYKFGPMSKEHKIRISKSLTGKSNWRSAEKLSIPVLKYDLAGNIVKEYKSLSEAIKVEGIKIKTYSTVNKTTGGFVWVNNKSRLPDFDSIRTKLDNWRKERMKPVMQISENGFVVNSFNGVRAASRQTGINHRSIQSVAAGTNPKRKTAGGYYWKYKEEL